MPAAKSALTPAEIAEIKEDFRKLREGMAARGVKVTQAEIAEWKNEGRR